MPVSSITGSSINFSDNTNNLTQDQDEATLAIIATIVTSISLLGSLLMTYFCLRSKSKSGTIVRRFILAIAVSDLLYSVL